jgi:hypothetical protein
MGASHSFEVETADTAYWKETVTTLLDKGFTVTIDYPAHQHETVLKMFSAGVWQSRMFIPMLRVCIPNVQTSSPNLVVKIDDIDFKATNPGVWCMHYHQLCDSNRFTDWQDYGTDIVIKRAVELQPSDVPAKAPEVVKPAAPAPVVKPVVKPAVVVDTNPMGLDVDASSALNNKAEVPAAKKEAVKNDQKTGLDPDSVSKLKPEPEAEAPVNSVLVDTSPKDIADAYTAGTKEDPLSKKVIVKTKVGKKT